MSKYRHDLPQLHGRKLFLTDGGLETSLIFHSGLDLPCFAAFDLLRRDGGCEALRSYHRPYIETAVAHGYGFVLDTATWRASADWGAKLGYTRAALAAANREAVRLMVELRDAHETVASPMVVSGAIGPRGDGYVAGELMSAAEAADYHTDQIAAFAASEADMVTAFTMTNAPEATGIVLAARHHRMPVAISFTLETDGRLPTGQSLPDAIAEVDAATGDAPAYYMINCAHPTHFEGSLSNGGAWLRRVRGIRANASKRSHAELDQATDLDAGDPHELAGQYRDLLRQHPQLVVLGGCCGTDHRHVASIGETVKRAA